MGYCRQRDWGHCWIPRNPEGSVTDPHCLDCSGQNIALLAYPTAKNLFCLISFWPSRFFRLHFGLNLSRYKVLQTLNQTSDFMACILHTVALHSEMGVKYEVCVSFFFFLSGLYLFIFHNLRSITLWGIYSYNMHPFSAIILLHACACFFPESFFSHSKLLHSHLLPFHMFMTTVIDCSVTYQIL